MIRDNFLLFKKLFLRKNNFLAIICLLAYLPSQADIVIRSSSTPFAQYAAWIATHPEDHSWVSQNEKFHPSKAEVARLSGLVESSQKAFLSGSLQEAQEKFKQIAALAFENDWHANEREAITYAMLRVAQLDKSNYTFIKKAATFGYDCHFNANLFPPPIMKAWNHEIALAKKKAVNVKNLKDFSGFEIMKVDGRTYSIQDADSVVIYPGEHRISFLGSSVQYFTQIMSSSQLQVISIEPTPLVSGSCDAPVLSPESHFQFTALFEDACARRFDGQVWSNQKTKIDKLDVQKINFRNTEQNFDPTLAKEPSTKNSHTLLWIGIGTAVITSLVLVYQNNQNQFSNMMGGAGAAGSPTAPAVTPVHRKGN